MCRKRGRIVLVGVTGLELSRADFYEKELTFQVSCSYGPGRYDLVYEGKGMIIRSRIRAWTVGQEILSAFLESMLTEGRSLTSVRLMHHGRSRMRTAADAYDETLNDGSGLGVLLDDHESSNRQDQKTAQQVVAVPLS